MVSQTKLITTLTALIHASIVWLPIMDYNVWYRCGLTTANRGPRQVTLPIRVPKSCPQMSHFHRSSMRMFIEQSILGQRFVWFHRSWTFGKWLRRTIHILMPVHGEHMAQLEQPRTDAHQACCQGHASLAATHPRTLLKDTASTFAALVMSLKARSHWPGSCRGKMRSWRSYWVNDKRFDKWFIETMIRGYSGYSGCSGCRWLIVIDSECFIELIMVEHGLRMVR